MKVFVLFFLAVVSPALGIKYSDCGSTGKLSVVSVSGCENLDVCPLKRGTKVSLTLTFDSASASNTLKAVAHGIIAGVPMPFPLPQSDACKESGVSCPLQKDNQYTYTSEFEVKTSYPRIAVDVKWELRDDNSNDVVCVKIPCKLE